MKIFVKLLPIANDRGASLAVYEHPIYEKKIYRLFDTTAAAFSYKLHTERDHSLATPIEEMKIKQLLLLYKKERPESQLFKYRRLFLLGFLEIFGDYYPAQVCDKIVDAWLLRYAEDKKLTRLTLMSERTFINYFFRYLVEKEVIRRSPITNIGLYERKVRLLSQEEITVIKSEAKRLSPGHVYPMVLLAIEARARSKEIYTLRWRMVDLKKGIIYFDRKGALVKHRMSAELHETMNRIKRESLLVFVSQTGRPIDNHTMFQTRSQLRKRSTFKKNWTFEDLRSSA